MNAAPDLKTLAMLLIEELEERVKQLVPQSCKVKCFFNMLPAMRINVRINSGDSFVLFSLERHEYYISLDRLRSLYIDPAMSRLTVHVLMRRVGEVDSRQQTCRQR